MEHSSFLSTLFPLAAAATDGVSVAVAIYLLNLIIKQDPI